MGEKFDSLRRPEKDAVDWFVGNAMVKETERRNSFIMPFPASEQEKFVRELKEEIAGDLNRVDEIVVQYSNYLFTNYGLGKGKGRTPD